MSFFPSTTFTKPKSRKQNVSPSGKWTRLGEPKQKSTGLRKIGKKGDWWLCVAKIIDRFLLKIDLPKTCEIKSEFCDNYHLQPAHTRRRQDIRVGDWWYAVRIVVGCSECHFWADSQGRRTAEEILEPIVQERFKRLGLDEDEVKRLLLLSANEVQEENPKFSHYYVVFD